MTRPRPIASSWSTFIAQNDAYLQLLRGTGEHYLTDNVAEIGQDVSDDRLNVQVLNVTRA